MIASFPKRQGRYNTCLATIFVSRCSWLMRKHGANLVVYGLRYSLMHTPDPCWVSPYSMKTHVSSPSSRRFSMPSGRNRDSESLALRGNGLVSGFHSSYHWITRGVITLIAWKLLQERSA